MARKRDRIFALVMAGAFIITTVGVSVALIWQIVDESKTKKATDTALQAVDQSNKKDSKDMLAGKPLQNFTPVNAVDQLQIIDTTPGDGAEVKAGDTVTVDYTGAVAATGTVFQSSLDSGQQATFGLNQVIPGWTEGMVGMKVNGTRRLVIPAAKAYGANPPQGSGIPADAPLVFDIVLHKIGQ